MWIQWSSMALGKQPANRNFKAITDCGCEFSISCGISRVWDYQLLLINDASMYQYMIRYASLSKLLDLIFHMHAIFFFKKSAINQATEMWRLILLGVMPSSRTLPPPSSGQKSKLEPAEYEYKYREDKDNAPNERSVASCETAMFILTAVRVTKHRCVTCGRMLGFQRQ